MTNAERQKAYRERKRNARNVTPSVTRNARKPVEYIGAYADTREVQAKIKNLSRDSKGMPAGLTLSDQLRWMREH